MAQFKTQSNGVTSENKFEGLLSKELQNIQNGCLTIVMQDNQAIQLNIYQKYTKGDYLC